MTQQVGDWYPTGASPAPSAYLQWTDASGNANALNFDLVLSEDWDEPTEVTEHAVEVGSDVADHVRVSLVKCELKVFSSNQPISVANSGPTPLATQPNIQATQGPLTLPVPTVGWTAQSLTLQYPTWNNPILQRALLESATGVVGNAVGGATGSVIGAAAGGVLGALLLAPSEQTVTQGTSAGLAPPVSPSSLTVAVNQWANITDFVAAMHALLVSLKNSATTFTVVGTKRTLYPMVIEALSFHRDNSTGGGEEITIGLKEVRIVQTSVVPLPISNLPAGGGTPSANLGAQNPTPAPASVAYQGLIGAINTLLPPAQASAVLSSLPSSFGGG